MAIEFPYAGIQPLDVPPSCEVHVYNMIPYSFSGVGPVEIYHGGDPGCKRPAGNGLALLHGILRGFGL